MFGCFKGAGPPSASFPIPFSCLRLFKASLGGSKRWQRQQLCNISCFMFFACHSFDDQSRLLNNFSQNAHLRQFCHATFQIQMCQQIGNHHRKNATKAAAAAAAFAKKGYTFFKQINCCKLCTMFGSALAGTLVHVCNEFYFM